jgi:hypothetical protein
MFYRAEYGGKLPSDWEDFRTFLQNQRKDSQDVINSMSGKLPVPLEDQYVFLRTPSKVPEPQQHGLTGPCTVVLIGKRPYEVRGKKSRTAVLMSVDGVCFVYSLSEELVREILEETSELR